CKHTEEIERFGIGRLPIEDPAVELLRLRQPAGLVMLQGELELLSHASLASFMGPHYDRPRPRGRTERTDSKCVRRRRSTRNSRCLARAFSFINDRGGGGDMRIKTVVFALGALAAATAVLAQQPAQQGAAKNLKFQSTWPASLTLQDNFRDFAQRVDKLTRGEVKIEAMAAGQIVPPFENLDATHKKVLDGGHGVAYYWVGKNKTATLFSATPAGPFGMDHFDFLGWLQEGGGQALYDEFYRDILKLNVLGMPIGGSSPQAFGWFKRAIQNLARFQGLESPPPGTVARNHPQVGRR